MLASVCIRMFQTVVYHGRMYIRMLQTVVYYGRMYWPILAFDLLVLAFAEVNFIPRSLASQMLRATYLKLDHDHFLPHPLKFISH
jgi:hypothetical protein